MSQTSLTWMINERVRPGDILILLKSRCFINPHISSIEHAAGQGENVKKLVLSSMFSFPIDKITFQKKCGSMKRNMIIGFIIMGIVCGGVGYVKRATLRRIAHALTPGILKEQQEEVTFVSGNLQLYGTLYTPGWSLRKHPAVIVCHGGTPIGRRMALYTVMARELAARGYVVLTFDFRGFGDSEDPQRFETFSDLDFTHDVSAALDYVSELGQVDTSRLFLIGHSFGAGVVLPASVRDRRVRKVISISPPRNTAERQYGPNAIDPSYPQKRLSKDMNIHPPIPQEVFYPHLKEYVAEDILRYPEHLPVLFIDGAEEEENERDFLREVYEQMAEPKAYTTIQGADHYFGTTRNLDGSVAPPAYDATVMSALIERIDEWFRNP